MEEEVEEEEEVEFFFFLFVFVFFRRRRKSRKHGGESVLLPILLSLPPPLLAHALSLHCKERVELLERKGWSKGASPFGAGRKEGRGRKGEAEGEVFFVCEFSFVFGEEERTKEKKTTATSIAFRFLNPSLTIESDTAACSSAASSSASVVFSTSAEVMEEASGAALEAEAAIVERPRLDGAVVVALLAPAAAAAACLPPPRTADAQTTAAATTKALRPRAIVFDLCFLCVSSLARGVGARGGSKEGEQVVKKRVKVDSRESKKDFFFPLSSALSLFFLSSALSLSLSLSLSLWLLFFDKSSRVVVVVVVFSELLTRALSLSLLLLLS